MNYEFDNEMIDSNLFKNFIKINENDKKFKKYIKEPNEINKIILDEAFKKHTKIALAVSYLKKIIYFESRRFDIKVRKLEQKESLLLDTYNTPDYTDTLIDEEAERQLCHIENSSLANVITNNILLEAIFFLTEHQQKILYYSYVLELKDKEIASKFNISQQAISRSRKQAIIKLQKILKNN